ncbi:type VII secretion integral membrane protein EccD [Phytohabitans flavus]|uniref:Type VII secretion integral membrane protein EccD n=1 Tax=Phytohabitans flavus TaxID=1076124 RepID=A0A6F8XLL2_9ACTN|nr:type VII secretion integral membrane protein EccD [Phytohabitans flavus]
MVGPERQVEVAVPSHVAIADLLPTLLNHLGAALADEGLTHGGWVLQRLGESPLDEDGSAASLGLRDGETVHLRPRSEQLPAVDFDDLIDGVGTGVSERASRWRPEMTRWALLISAAVVLALGLVVVALPGPQLGRALAGGAMAIAGLLGGFAVAYATSERVLSALLAAAGMLYGACAAAVVAGGEGVPAVAGPTVFAGAAAFTAVAAVACYLLGAARLLFAPLAVAGLLAVLGGALTAYLDLPPVGSAGIVATVATATVVLVPMNAFRLAGLRLSPLPTEPEHLQEDIEPVPSGPLLSGAANVDRLMTALYSGLALPALVALVIVGLDTGWAAPVLASLLGLVRLLAARPMTSGWHRLTHLVPAAAGLCAASVAGARATPDALRPVLLVAVVVVVFGLSFATRILPERRLMPIWGRVGDITLTVAAVAVLPILCAVLGLYGYVRSLGG